MENIKRNAKDTVFRDLFSNKKYLLQLYLALHPDDTSITENDLDIVTLESIFMNGVYNDLGFLVRENQLVILVEAQSTWSPNIVIRSLIYLMATCQEYFYKNNIQLYSSVKAHMPTPELYVIYTGEKGSQPEILSLKDEFFQNTDCCIDARVRVIYLKDSNDIINQYIGFCRVFNQQIHKYGRTLKAAKEIIRVCRDSNLLKDYLGEKELEVEGIMLTLFDQDRVWDIEKKNIKEESKKEIVMEMLKNNIPIEMISKVTKMAVEQVNGLKVALK